MKALKKKNNGGGDKLSSREAKLVDLYNKLADKSERLTKKYNRLKGKEEKFDESKLPGLEHYPAGSKSKRFGERAGNVKGKLLGYKKEFNSIKDEAEAILKKMGK
tara:strand:- start:191 stop:505 length:315 start_codon:yes stop_codon:yes gene_type:complete